MPGTHPRNAKIGVTWRCGATCRGSDDERLTVEHDVALGRWRFDGISIWPDNRPGLDAVEAINMRKHATPARTLARRREVVQLAQEAADVQGWTLTADERTMIEAFAGDRETAR